MFMSGGYGGYEEEPYSSPPPVPAAPKPTIEQQLLNLQELQNKGLITEDDYNSKKKQILGIWTLKVARLSPEKEFGEKILSPKSSTNFALILQVITREILSSA